MRPRSPSIRQNSMLVVGLDGATLELILPWVEAGALPTFSKIIRSGVTVTSLSTIPALTPPAWVSSVTGVNPGKHGIYDFIVGKERYHQRPARSSDWGIEPIWHRLGREGIKVGVVNFPLTYPPFAVNGFMVSGMLTPRHAQDAVHPPGLFERIDLPGGRSDLGIDEKNLAFGNRRAFLRDLTRVTRSQARVARQLARSFDVEFLQVVFDGVDRLQHYFWQFLDETGGKPKGTQDAILRHYRCLDECLGSLMSDSRPESYVIVYSDHGFGPLHRRVHIEQLLSDLGFLSWRAETTSAAPRGRLGLSKERAEALAYKLGLGTTLKRLLPLSWKNALPQGSAAPFEQIEWEQTTAFFASAPNQSIRLNLVGREPKGIVQPGEQAESVCRRIIERLEALLDPVTGKSPIARVHRREDLYHGPYVDRADDLIVTCTPGSYLVGGRSPTILSDSQSDRFGWSGTHRREGVLILTGPGIRRGVRLDSAHVEDVAPMVLYLMGLSIPEYMDGRVLAEAFEPEFMRNRPVVCRPESAPIISVRSERESDENELLGRLQDLGYIE